MKEEIVANAELVDGDFEVEVVAALELPQNLMRRPKLTLRPTYENLRKLSHFSKLRLKIEQRVNGALVRKVDVEECWFLNAECRHWSETLKDCQVETDPRGIRVTEWREYQAAYPVVTFWLSGNRVLRPSCIDNRFESGDRQVDVVAAYVMRLPEAFVLHNNHYWWSAEDGVVSVSSNLVARNVKALSEEGMPSEDELLKRVDDWLLLASLATRRRTVCVGWSKIDQEKFVRCYRGDISVPVNDSTATDAELISPDLIQRFLDQSIAKIVDGDPSADAMRRLISAVVPVSKSTVEEDLLTLFSALEEVLLTFRREAGLEFSLDPQRWIGLRKLIKNVVRDSVEDKRAREQIYEKIPELNRVSAAYVFNRYVDQYGIDLNGLWPIFDRSGGVSVYEIRNWLAHGVKLSGDATGHLWVVNSHLRWLLERIALIFFGWNLGSDVEERRLADYVAYCEFVNVRREMTAFMNEKKSV